MAVLLSVLDRRTIEDLAVSPDVLRHLFDAYRTDAIKRIQTLREVAAKGDVTYAKQLLHALKGSSATLGAERFAAELLAIEECGQIPSDEMIARIETEFGLLVVALKSIEEELAHGHS